MQIAVSIEPYLVVEKIRLTQYIENIIQISRKLAHEQQKVLIHFDCFQANPDVFQLVQKYTDQIDIDLHLMQESVSSVAGFRSVSFDIADWYKNLPVATSDDLLAANMNSVDEKRRGVVLDLGCEIRGNNHYEDLIRAARYIILMTVKCGKSGQTFQVSALKLIPEIRRLNPNATIIVDGGVNDENILLLKEAGVDVAVVGNYAKKCYENGELETGINRLLRD